MMADVARVCVLLFVCAGVHSAVISAKGFFCRDPDTGKLYNVNATWPSSTFCGNYICKLRKRNITETEYEPLREINIPGNQFRNDADNEDTHKENTPVTIEERTEPYIQPVFHKGTDELEKIKANFADTEDRYLTENEIKSITDLLHTVKKSDLEAIIEIYNLAQDIYKEMDKASNDNLIEQMNGAKGYFDKVKPTNNHINYWYDPLEKHKMKDMQKEGTNVQPSTVPPTVNPDPYLRRTTDYQKLPYYYPMSEFQRIASYIHQPNYIPPTSTVKPIPREPSRVEFAPAPLGIPSVPSGFNGVIKKPFTVDTQRGIQPPMLLPYPFTYINHYNMTSYPGYFSPGNPWTHFNLYNQNRNHQAYLGGYIAPVPKIVNSIPKDVNVEQKPAEEAKTFENLVAKPVDKRPDWQTDPIPADVLEEVRANMKQRLIRPFPLRKKIKLEKVGKVIKLDELTRPKRDLNGEKSESVEPKQDLADKEDEVTRAKRNMSEEEEPNEEDFEAYIERTTCDTDTEPGFFRVGNTSQPYPACCPQRIKKS